MEGDRGAERIEVGKAAGRDGRNVDDVRGGTEVDATFDERQSGDVGRGGGEAADTDGEHAAAAEAGGRNGAEGTEVTSTVGAIVVERKLPEGVIPEQDDGTVPVDGDLIASGDGRGTVGK